MKIKNKTRYDGRKIRSIFTAVASRERKLRAGHKPHVITKLNVHSTAGRTITYCSVPSAVHNLLIHEGREDVAKIAAMLHHLLLHQYGVLHPDMTKAQRFADAAMYRWVGKQLGYETIEEAAAKPKPTPDIEIVRRADHDRLLEREGKLRKNVTQLKAAMKRARRALSRIVRERKKLERATNV